MKKEQVYKIYLLVFSLLCFTVPFESVIRIVPNLLLVILAVLSPFVFRKTDFKNIKKAIVYKWVIIFIGYLLLSTLVNQAFLEDLYVLKKIIFILPVLLLTIPIKQYKYPLLFFNIGVLAVISISFFRIINYYLQNGSFEFFKGDIINSILLVERLYLGFMATICFTIGLFNYKRKENANIQIFYTVNTIVCAVFVITISARIGVVSIVLVSLIRVFHDLSIIKALVVAGALLLIITTVFKINPNLASRFFYPKNDKQSYIHKLKEWEPRYVIWNCSYNIFFSKNNVILGSGFQNIENKLLHCYETTISKKGRRQWFLKKGYNTHNQFIDILLGKGVLGLMIFCSLFFLLLRKNKKDLLKLNLLIILILFGLVENFFHRQIGVYLFTFIITFVNFNDKLLKIEK